MSKDPRLQNLKEKIDKAKGTFTPRSFKKEQSTTPAGRFFNVGVELTAGVIIGVGLGLFIDWVFHISPWGLITFFILGSVAGMMNVYRALMKDKPENKKKDRDG